MPRKVAKDDEMPRRRRGARAVAIEADAERGLAMRILLHSPKDMVAGVLAFAAVSAIIANALFLQTGHHPSPMFGSVVVMPPPGLASASPLPRPRPVEADTESRCRTKVCRTEGRPKGLSSRGLPIPLAIWSRRPAQRRWRLPMSCGRPRRSRFRPAPRYQPIRACTAWRRCNARSPNTATAS